MTNKLHKLTKADLINKLQQNNKINNKPNIEQNNWIIKFKNYLSTSPTQYLKYHDSNTSAREWFWEIH